MKFIRANNIVPAVTFLIAGLLSITACRQEPVATESGGRQQTLRVEGYVLTAGTFEKDYTASGSILPNESISIVPEITGRVTGLHFREGVAVRKGQPLVTLYHDDILARIDKLKAQKSLQEGIQKRQTALLRIGGISQQEYETTETQVSAINADIAAEEAELRKTKIIAPFDGVVGIRNISAGATIASGTVIATLQQTDPLKMDFMIPEHHHRKIHTGSTVYFTVKGDSIRRTGTISAIEPGASGTTRSIKVRAAIPNKNGQLIPGSFAEVTIPFQSNDSALLIPSQSIIPTTRDKKVAIVRNGRAELVTVRLGMRTSGMVEVIQGLKAGDTVITTGLMQVKPGVAIQFTAIHP